MNTSKVGQFFIVFLIGSYGLFVVASMFGGGSNALSGAIWGLFPICVIASLVSQKVQWFLLISLACFGDLLKRVLILYGDFNFMDIAAPLSLAPAILFLVIAVSFYPLFLSARTSNRYIFIFLGCLVWAGFSAINALKAGFSAQSLQELVNGAGYVNLCWIVPLAIRSKVVNVHVLLNSVLSCLFIAVLYGLWQSIFGITRFEEAYILSGFTLLINHYDGKWMRPFSTFSSIHAYSIVTLLAVSIVVINSKVRLLEGLRVKKFQTVFLFILFFVAMIIGLGRAAWLGFGVTVLMALSIRRLGTTLALYFFGLVAVVILVMSSGFILERLDDYQDISEEIGGYSNTRTGKAVQVSSYSDRLQGFNNIIENSEMRTAFGVKGYEGGRKMYSHDPITSALRDHGFVPVTVFGLILLFVVVQAHRKILAIRNREQKVAVCWLVGTVGGVVVSGALSGDHLHLVPVNLITWMLCGIAIYYTFEWRDDTSENSVVEESLSAARLPSVGHHARRRRLEASTTEY